MSAKLPDITVYAPNELGSLWDGLNPNLIASFYEVDSNGDQQGETIVKAPLTEANFEATFNWQSPFENTGAESGLPTVTAMLQSGAIQPYIDGLSDDGIIGTFKNKLNEYAGSVKSKTGITKLNSTQVFTGMPPIKIPVTLIFRAWRNSVEEVENPVDQLMKWALPKTLAGDGTFISRTGDAVTGDGSALDVLLPSSTPTMIGMHYKNKLYAPLVIESINMPINSQIDRDGNFVELLIPMTLATLTAIDANDWDNLSGY